MARYAFLVLLTPCLLPVLGVALLAAASLWRAMTQDAKQRRGRDPADRRSESPG